MFKALAYVGIAIAAAVVTTGAKPGTVTDKTTAVARKSSSTLKLKGTISCFYLG
jgi:hypothetical protein